jgi:hypothetical protein
VNLDTAIVYDIETFPNAFTLHMQMLNGNVSATWEISQFRDDRQALLQWFKWLHDTQTPMIGFNNLNFDYPVIHFIANNPQCTVEQIYEKAMSIINSGDDRFGHMIWPDKRFAPQIDLFKLHHMDNKAKSTSLKALQINMRSRSVEDMPVPVGTILTEQQINELLIPYNKHDVSETKQFAHMSMDAIKYRVSLIEQFGIDVFNWPDTKIGSTMMVKRIGYELCYDHSSGRKQTRQSPRQSVALSEIIFPYIKFENPEFQRVHEYLSRQVIKRDELTALGEGESTALKTKGIFTNIVAHVGDIDFDFGTGGIHGSIEKRVVHATDEWLIRDIDVAALYPSIAIANRLYPEHLGARFHEVYSELPKERKRWQKEKGKKCVEANTLKLAGNGVYGNSNNQYSPFYDPRYMLSITINGQLMLCMLAERLFNVPTFAIIQINTDGITYLIHRDYETQAAALCRQWEELTGLVLEDANYSCMWIRDVNNYIAQSTDGTLKTKGAYWTPDPLDWAKSIGDAQPAAWHKDLSNVVSINAAVAAMVHGVDPETFIRLCGNPYDFMCRAKVGRQDMLMHGAAQIQRTSRYYVAQHGQPLQKIAPASGKPGAFKRGVKVSEADYLRVMNANGWQWDASVCTQNRSTYEQRETSMCAGYMTAICNDVADFNFANVNYKWYVDEAKKLII